MVSLQRNDKISGRRTMSAARTIGGALAVAATIVIAPAQAQAPAPTAAAPWAVLAPFPDPSEEVLGASVNGKLYVFCGLGPNWTPKGLVYEYDPAGNKWTPRKPMQLPSHHVAFA